MALSMEQGEAGQGLVASRRQLRVGEFAPAERVVLLHVAAMKPNWETTYYAVVLTLNTTMRGGELKALRWRNIDLMGKSLRVLKTKTKKGVRIIPLNPDAMEVILALYRRAQQIGAANPDDYVFFTCESGHIDFTRPQKSWSTSWRSLRKAAGLPN